MFLAYKSIIAYRCVILRSTDEHRLSDYSIGPEAKLNLVIRPSGEKTGASGAGPSSSSTQGRVWQIASTILAKHFSPADASKVHENLIKVFECILLNNVYPSIIWSPSQWALVITGPTYRDKQPCTFTLTHKVSFRDAPILFFHLRYQYLRLSISRY